MRRPLSSPGRSRRGTGSVRSRTQPASKCPQAAAASPMPPSVTSCFCIRLHSRAFPHNGRRTHSHVPEARRRPVARLPPGGPGVSAALFADLGGLDRERTLIQLNPRGVDGSDPAETYELEDYAADLEQLREHLGLERIDLFGHSAGGFMSMLYAATWPRRVGKLVLCGSCARFSDEFQDVFERFLAGREHDPRFADAVAARRAREENPPEDDEEL